MNVQNIAEALRNIGAEMDAAGDHQRAVQAQELNSKLTEGRLTVALCGHFSAGKSTLVNALCGAKLLPSSPIPTSANVVSIRGGERAYASVETESDGMRAHAEVPIGELDTYCKDGERFLSVSIHYPSELLGNDLTLLDTPGIDSTDDAHRLATESALHLADVVFYVMDYNHVQSEINFAFAKSLKDWGKPLYFIVNQIDKHRDRELSFDAYKRSVEEAFHAWHLEPAGIMYLSLRKPEHPQHQWDVLMALIGQLKISRDALCAYSVDASLRHLAAEHVKWAKERSEPERDRLIAEAGGEEALAVVKAEAARLTSRLDTLAAEKETYRSNLRKELQSILDNANITPAALRDLAHAFLDSRRPGFKAGLLFSGAKTAAEQERRLESFRGELVSLTNASIDWHVKQLLRQAASGAGYASEELEGRLAEKLGWQPDGEWLESRVKQGAVFGNEYTMTFSKELSADVKSEFRRRALEIIDDLADHAAASGEAAIAIAKAQVEELRGRTAAVDALSELDLEAERKEAHILASLPARPDQPVLPHPDAIARLTDANRQGEAASTEADAPEQLQHSYGQDESLHAKRQVAAAKLAASAVEDLAPEQSSTIRSKQLAAAKRMRLASELLAPHKLLQAPATALREKADRLGNSRFTIALFGAFSAGKSSLANALIGEAVLPVSPNPTTAAINRLMPPTEQFGHGTARVAMKAKEAMLDDLRYSLSLLGEQATKDTLPDGQAILSLIDKLSPDAIGAGGRPHYSFLRAARNGWQAHEALLGTELHVDRDEYASYVADESRSCFVSEIDFHYDCPLTSEGIVLVDTPGADSVNARHTGVSFNYIKNADAVLFVTYYNHAFSQADRQFLDQLGRVKDQFELDKMFFIVNAADLAADEEELQHVLMHVEHNLLQHAIRHPRLYPVSSIEALDGKQDRIPSLVERSRIVAFEQDFMSFIATDLGALAIDSAEQELNRTVSLIEGWIRSAEGDEAAREAEREKLAAALLQVQPPVDRFRGSVLPEGLKQEMTELLYYVAQRLQFRLGDFYHLAFNPASLQDDGRDLKRVVWTGWLELQRLIQRELAQELQATSLRVERAMNGTLKQLYGSCSEELGNLLTGYDAAPFASQSLSAPEEALPWEEGRIEARWLWSRFKSPRQFFEGDGKALLRKELEGLIVPSVQQWTNAASDAWRDHYGRIWSAAANAAAEKLSSDVSAYSEGKRQSLAGGSAAAELTELRESLIHIQKD
ncbi:dynamin family protein [Paenibacillus sp. LHD-117]|uniref:dynamin family protein n=1 Tax=Paenibacillus sp. LHD-117 TaxID=3071412 RepID=UPI0027E12291|nr:dynamin family protein [Paenibacillus sp. LHD-117]MDQ6418166.1 dynamin family protein [Paenibacillus sp. LHD-117]